MDVNDRAQILEKIHRMRLRVAERKGLDEPGKSIQQIKSLTDSNDRDKIMEQYFAAKR